MAINAIKILESELQSLANTPTGSVADSTLNSKIASLASADSVAQSVLDSKLLSLAAADSVNASILESKLMSGLAENSSLDQSMVDSKAASGSW